MKRVKNNKKGMTLIEMIIVLMMASVLLMVIGGFIVNSLGYFDGTVDQDISKQALDSTVSYVRDELLYASDVRVYSPQEVVDNNLKLEEWRTFHVKDGKLYHDGEEIFGKGFYKNKRLEIKAKSFVNDYRLDLQYALFDGKDKVYSSFDTLELLNLKVKMNNEEGFKPLSNIISEVIISENKKIYYRKDFAEIPKGEEGGGTVEEQEKCINDYNNRGVFVGNRFYRKGDYVRYDGAWWQNVEGDRPYEASEGPGTNFFWKKLAQDFVDFSSYQRGDVVHYKGSYYEYISGNRLGYTVIPEVTYEWKSYWKKLDSAPKQELICPDFSLEERDTVLSKIEAEGVVIENMETYDEAKYHSYKRREFVKMYNKETDVWEYYQLLGDVNNYNGVVNPGKLDANGRTPWQKIQRDYDPYSMYEQGDIIMFYDMGEKHYIRCNQTSDKPMTINELSSSGIWNPQYWSRI